MRTVISITLAFALLSFVALAAYLASDFWLSALVIAAVVALLALLFNR